MSTPTIRSIVPTHRLETAEEVQALCRETDPESFFPQQDDSTEAAIRLCHQCPIEARCLEIALVNGEQFGVWGGTTPAQRRAMAQGAA